MSVKKKSPARNARPQKRRSSKTAPSRGSVSMKSGKQNEEKLVVRTPRNSRFLGQHAIIAPEEIDPSEETVPLDFTVLSDRDVGTFHSRFAVRMAHALYVRSSVATRLVRLRYKRRLDLSRFRVENAEEYKTVGELEAAFSVGPGQRTEKNIASLEVKAEALDAVIQGYEQIVKAASREMSRRDSERSPRD